jgi:drug/metabolite transporter (DMT)-like permease
VLSACCFGTSGPLARAALDAGLTAEQVTTARICLAAALLLVGTALLRPRALRVRRHDVPALIAYGLVGVAAVQLLSFISVARLPVGVALLLEYLSPVLVTLWVRFVRRTVPHRAVWLGVALAVTGLVLVARVWDGLSLDTVGLVAGLGTAGCSAVYFLLGERSVATIDPVGVTTWGLVIGAIAISGPAPPWSMAGLVGVRATFGPWQAPLWQLLAVVAVVSTVVAYLAGIASMRHLPSSVVSVLSLIEPLVATTLAWALLHQSLTAIQLVGGAILLTGALTVQLASQATREPAHDGRAA